MRGARDAITRPRRHIPTVVLVCFAVAASTGPHTAQANSLLTGFTDVPAYQVSASDRAAAIAHTRQARATVVRIGVSWAAVSPRRPPNRSLAQDPAWTGYDWSALDPVLRDLRAGGLRGLLTVSTAPRWAEARHRPAVTRLLPAGTWYPSDRAFGDFARALALRYSGTFPDPVMLDSTLPRVALWEVWNEPNISNLLNPQVVRRGRGLVFESPEIYRRLLNAFYAGVKGVDPSSVVMTGGLEPFGDLPGPHQLRLSPLGFLRALLCLREGAHLRRVPCGGGPARFDAVAHHPYSRGGPPLSALNPDDVTIPNLGRLRRVVRAAVRLGTAAPRTSKQLWVTEAGWNTRPPNPGGVPVALAARWLEGAFYEFWRQGVSGVTWYELRDESPGSLGYPSTHQFGVYYLGHPGVAQDRPKPGLEAFRFPFTAYRVGRSADAWGMTPDPDTTVVIEQRRRGHWDELARLRSGVDRIFRRRLVVPVGSLLRARIPGESSLTWLSSEPA